MHCAKTFKCNNTLVIIERQ